MFPGRKDHSQPSSLSNMPVSPGVKFLPSPCPILPFLSHFQTGYQNRCLEIHSASSADLGPNEAVLLGPTKAVLPV